LSGDIQCPSGLELFDPTKFETAFTQLSANAARDVGAAFAPIETWSAEDASRLLALIEGDAELRQERKSVFGDLPAVWNKRDVTAQDKNVGQRYAKPSGEVVITGAGSAHLFLQARLS
jgi:hypothetical protein